VSQVCDEAVQHSYVAALCGEITAAGGDFSVPVDTVFFGGGTPTVLAASKLELILQTLRTNFQLTADAEISLEANPGTVEPVSLKRLRQAGFNRLSLGVQSFDDVVLAAIGRIHRAETASRAMVEARAAGFDNISLDLMYGLPMQSISSWRETLEQAVSLDPEHISAYGLKLEEGTPLMDAVNAGRVALPSEEDEEAMYDWLNLYLPSRGYARYEISNYATKGNECRHNLKYWRYQPYRGLGVAAHSFDGVDRYANTGDISMYLGRLAAGDSPEDFRESLNLPTMMAEYVFLALRTTEGLSGSEFEQRFGETFSEYYSEPVRRLTRLGLLKQENLSWHLTKRGMKLGNQAFAEFLP
jgi:oxygen-independent coproporphyrinogen-3 oxidase